MTLCLQSKDVATQQYYSTNILYAYLQNCPRLIQMLADITGTKPSEDKKVELRKKIEYNSVDFLQYVQRQNNCLN